MTLESFPLFLIQSRVQHDDQFFGVTVLCNCTSYKKELNYSKIPVTAICVCAGQVKWMHQGCIYHYYVYLPVSNRRIVEEQFVNASYKFAWLWFCRVH